MRPIRLTALAAIGLMLMALPAAEAALVEQIPPDSRIYIAPMDGFDLYLAAALSKTRVPLVVVGEESKAEYEVTGASESEQASWARVIFLAQTGSREQVGIKVVNLKTGAIAFGYAVDKRSSIRGKQSVAEACAKHLKSVIGADAVETERQLSAAPPPRAAPAQPEPAAEQAYPGPSKPALDAPEAIPVIVVDVPVAKAPAPAPRSANELVEMTFVSNPPEALVSFSGMVICHTPCVMKLQARKYPVKMTLAGFADWTDQIAVEAGKPSTVAAEMTQH
jgi:hypothetical protein